MVMQEEVMFKAFHCQNISLISVYIYIFWVRWGGVHHINNTYMQNSIAFFFPLKNGKAHQNVLTEKTTNKCLKDVTQTDKSYQMRITVGDSGLCDDFQVLINPLVC